MVAADGAVQRRSALHQRAQRAQLALPQAVGELRRRDRAREPRQLRQRAGRQHRLQTMLAALSAAAVRQRRKPVA